MKALIMAGGKGTRLLEITKDLLPKPMVKLYDRPLLEYAIDNLKKYGIKDIFISVSYMHEVIQEYFGNGEKFGVRIKYIVEFEPLGSGGALYYLKDEVDDDFVVCMGDALFNINIKKMLDYHRQKKSIATLLVHPNHHPYDSDLIMCSSDNRVLELSKKGAARNFWYKNSVNAGFFIINPKALYYFDELKKVSMEHDFIQHLVDDGQPVYAYKSTEYIKDVGTPERYYNAMRDVEAKVPQKKNLENKQKAIFFDRDGTLNVYNGFIRNPDQLELVPNCAEALKEVNKSEYLAIVISNQPVVARGECSFDELDNIFNKMETLLGREGAYVDRIYFCPHHPDSGFEGEVKELKIKCDCRKPKIGMIEKAVRDFNLDLSKCWLVGDTDIDIKTGKNANLKTIKVPSLCHDVGNEIPTLVAKDIVDAVEKILNLQF